MSVRLVGWLVGLVLSFLDGRFSLWTTTRLIPTFVQAKRLDVAFVCILRIGVIQRASFSFSTGNVVRRIEAC